MGDALVPFAQRPNVISPQVLTFNILLLEKKHNSGRICLNIFRESETVAHERAVIGWRR